MDNKNDRAFALGSGGGKPRKRRSYVAEFQGTKKKGETKLQIAYSMYLYFAVGGTEHRKPNALFAGAAGGALSAFSISRFIPPFTAVVPCFFSRQRTTLFDSLRKFSRQIFLGPIDYIYRYAAAAPPLLELDLVYAVC